jgi:hypothetical protein
MSLVGLHGLVTAQMVALEFAYQVATAASTK